MELSNKMAMKKSFYFICDRSKLETVTAFNPKKLYKTTWECSDNLIHVKMGVLEAIEIIRKRSLGLPVPTDELCRKHYMTDFHVFKTAEDAENAISALKKYYDECDLPIGDWIVGEVKKIAWYGRYFIVSPEIEWVYR